jgi:starch synthase
MKINRVLFISQEIFPYLPASEVSTVCRDLPQGIQERGREIRTFMPKYGSINERRNQLHEVIRLSGMNLIIDDNDYPLIIKVASIQSARMQVYFIDNDDFFQRKHTVADDEGVEFEDNDDRCIFFVRGVIETIRKLRWVPDVVHVHGWIAALAPLYIKRAFADDPCFRSAKVVYSVYDNAFKMPFRDSFRQKLMIDGVTEADLQDLEGDIDYVSMSKMAMRYSDGVIQGSETVNPAVMALTTTLEVPFLAFQDKDCYIDSYNEFYDTVCD